MIKLKKNTKYLIIGTLFLGGILLFTYGFSFARYISNTVWNHYLQTKGFYFNSKTLGKDVVNNIWDGESIYFDLENSLNDLVATDYDITYQVTCNIIESDVSSQCYINGTNSNTYIGTLSSDYTCINDTGDGVIVSDFDRNTCQMQGYRYAAVKTVQDIYFDIVGNANDVLANITVTSLEPYTKTISSDFILHKDQSEEGNIKLQYNENKQLIITNSYNEDKRIKINWNSSKLRIIEDVSSDFQVDTEGYINEMIITIDKKNSLSYQFYEINESSVNDFSLIELN